jgi:type VI secretion system secreted protein VgrG
MPTVSQDKRIAQLNTPLGKDVLVLVRIDGTEGLSELFEFRVEALSEQANLNFDSAIGQHCWVKFKSYDDVRIFDGILVEANWNGAKEDFHSYQLVFRPWLWLLSQRADCRIFQNKTVVEIIEQVFQDAGFGGDMRKALSGNYPQLEYCVQYRETDFAFVSRMMEHNGIYYFFEHREGKHTLVLADAPSSHQAVGKGTVPYLPAIDQDHRDCELVYDWASARHFRTGKFALTDYDFKQPGKDLKAEASGHEAYAKSDYEHYDYPGRHLDKSEGERLAKVRLEAAQARDHRRYAAGDAVSLYPGGMVTLQKHPESGENQKYLIVRTWHAFGSEDYRTSSGGQTLGRAYQGRYELQPSDRNFRAPLATAKPVIRGAQTAKVVDEKCNTSGEEIDVDEHGRIFVHFHWERKNKTSCRMRVAHVWSGKQWGGQHIPRVGQEVLVDFLEGDPDQPLVVGTVYNGDNKHPYKLPDDKTVSGLKSDSSKGGGGYNEFNFEDKKGSEKIGMHAEKDLEVVVLNTETRTIAERFAGGTARKTQIKNGDDKLDIDMGSLFVTAAVSIVLKVGPSKITIDNSGVTIDAPTINIKGVAAVNVSAAMVTIN